MKWAIENGLLPEDAKWYTQQWERGKVIEKDGKKLFWDWEHRMRTKCVARRPDLTLEDTSKKLIMLIDMACPNEANKETKRDEKIRKYQQLCYELRERRDGYKVMVILTIIGCLGGGMKGLKEKVKQIFGNDSDKALEAITRGMQKAVLWESESMIRKVLYGLLT